MDQAPAALLRTTLLTSSWEFTRSDLVSTKMWLPAKVPGHVHRDLVRQGVIGDPFYRLQEAGCPWVDEADWVYRTRFDWSADDGLPFRVLRFEGLDTVCQVLLNGELLIEADNMFCKHEADVSSKLREGVNELEVRFRSAVKEGRSRMAAYVESERLGESQSGGFFERSFVRKAQYMFGWDWGPRLVSCGIWKPVRLLEYRSRIEDVYVNVQRINLEQWAVRVEVEAVGCSEVEGRVRAYDPEGEVLNYSNQEGCYLATHPKLWNPNRADSSCGTHQPLGWVEVELVDAQGGILDRREVAFGFREVQLVREPDEMGECFRFVVNGRRVWVRGANWIPNHSFPSRPTASELETQVKAMVDLGFNMVRIWGGGLYESDEFYDACDRYGLMVWQDFAYACAYYPDGPEAQEACRLEAEEQVRRLRSHPSLAIWCGNNENLTMWESRWAGDRMPPRYYGEHLYRDVLPEVLSRLDPVRPYVESSPVGRDDDLGAEKSGHGYGCNMGGVGDQHYWDVWHGRGDWRHYADSRARFASEFGFSGSPHLLTWHDCLAPADRTPSSPAVRWHDKTGKSLEDYHDLIRLHYPEATSLDDHVYYSQLNQRDALRYGIEHYRRSEYCEGTLLWQFNDCWPVQSWAVQDSSKRLKLAGVELVRLYRDVLLSVVRDKDVVSLWCVNDGVDPLEDVRFQLEGRFLRTGMASPYHRTEVVRTVQPGQRVMVAQMSIKGLLPTGSAVVGSCPSRQDLDDTWCLLAEPKEVQMNPQLLKVWFNVPDGPVLEVSGPCVDLIVWDEEDEHFGHYSHGILRRGPALVTSFQRKTVRLACCRQPRLRARSLAGEHQIRMYR